MKYKIFIFFLLLTFSFSLPLHAQIPELEVVEDTMGITRQLSEYLESDKNYIISFWATWCAPCKREYDAWKEYASEWAENHQVEILAVSIDIESSIDRGMEIWATKEWKGQLLFADQNSAQTAFDFALIPQYFLYDTERNIVYEGSGYATGDAEALDDFIHRQFPVVSTQQVEDIPLRYTFYQDAESIHINWEQESGDKLKNLALYNLLGQQEFGATPENGTGSYTISKNALVKGQIYALQITQQNGATSSQLLRIE